MHAMIDVEALRLNRPWLAPLMQIGMVVFDSHANVLEELEWYVDQETLPDWASEEPSTVNWWKEQDAWPTMKKRLEEDSIPCRSALRKMEKNYREWRCETVWFAGPVYDQVMLEAYFEEFSIRNPWRFNDSRDFRTIRKQWPKEVESVPDNQSLHLAMQDCRHQVDRLKAITDATGMEWK